jgi:polysaccharide biosynthesis/export protein PslD
MRKLFILYVSLFALHGCSVIPNHYSEVPNKKHVYKEDKVNYFGHNYMLSPGDQIEVSYYIDVRKQDEYHIAIGDQIRVEFPYYPQFDRTINVRPDGKITVPQIGDVMAFGHEPMELAKVISDKFSHILRKPLCTVSLIRYGENIRELKDAIKTSVRGQSRLALIQPDGRISVPLLDPIRVAGMQIERVQELINQRYTKLVPGMVTSVSLLQATGNKIYIMGAVNDPGFYQIPGPTTVTQAIAIAEGFQKTADTREVLLISRDEFGRPVGRVIDIHEILRSGNLGLDIMVRQADIVYVPDTTLARAGIFMDQLTKLIPFNLNIFYDLENIVGARVTN